MVRQVLGEVAQWMRTYASALDGHAALVRRVTHNLAALRRARGDVYRTLKHVMRERRPRELVRAASGWGCYADRIATKARGASEAMRCLS